MPDPFPFAGLSLIHIPVVQFPLLLAAAAELDLDRLLESPTGALLVHWSGRVAAAAIILVIGLWLAFFISGAVRRRILKSTHIDQTLGRFFGSIVRYALVAIVVIAVLSKFGIQTTSLVAVLGAATLAIGLALQGTLADLAAGAMIVMMRPYKIGDYVDIGGKQGTVADITIFYTAMNTVDNRRIIIHNAKAWNDVIENFSINPTRRIDMTVSISYGDDSDRAIAVLRDVLAGMEQIHASPAPVVAVRTLGPALVDLAVRAWVDTSRFGDTQWELNKRVIEAFNAQGISLPHTRLPAPAPAPAPADVPAAPAAPPGPARPRDAGEAPETRGEKLEEAPPPADDGKA